MLVFIAGKSHILEHCMLSRAMAKDMLVDAKPQGEVTVRNLIALTNAGQQDYLYKERAYSSVAQSRNIFAQTDLELENENFKV